MAGPCAVESERQLLETAEAVAAAGARILRGGAYKPRSSPYAFQGLGLEGLKILRKAREETGLAIVTEVMSEEDVDLIAEYADLMQVGTRSMENYALLERLGGCGRPVLLKRGMTATLEELLRSAQVIAMATPGNPQIILCERGIRTFETATRNTLDIAAVPVLKTVSHLPVIVDPSHAAGVRCLVPVLARVAAVAGADGLLVEVHPSPDQALSDGAQSLTFRGFREMMDDLEPYLVIRDAQRPGPQLVAAGGTE
jgi:3-deoxy-7-phosphoheptulonate synthase